MRALGLIAGLVPSVASAAFVPAPNDGGLAPPTGDGATFVDLDGDGDLDFLTLHPEVWLGGGDGTFAIGPSCGPEGSPIVADFDNDGVLDVLRVRDAPVLCRGDGRGGLVLDESGVEPGPFVDAHHLGLQLAYAGGAADFDGDGWLDLYISDFEDHLAPEMPTTFMAYPDLFYANDGLGRLEVVGQAPTGAIFQNRGVTIGDFDDDTHPDVYSASYRLNRDLLWDIDAGSAMEVAEAKGCVGYGHTISASFGDFDGDLDLDIFVCNFAHPGNPESLLCRNDGGVFVEDEDLGIPWVESYASVAPQDYDTDGDLDVFIATVYPGDEGRLFRNDGTGAFADVTVEEGLAGQHEGYGAAWGDVDGDGDRDLYLGGLATQHLFLNEGDAVAHSIVVEPRGDGVRVDTFALGTRVVVRTGDFAVMREVEAGGMGGDRGGSEPALHFGLGDRSDPVEVEVRWRTGETCVWTRDVDTRFEPIYDPEDPACATEGDTTGGESTSTTGGETTSTSDSSTSGAEGSTSSIGDEPSSSEGAPAEPEASATNGCGCAQAADRGVGPWLGVLLLGLSRRRGR